MAYSGRSGGYGSAPRYPQQSYDDYGQGNAQQGYDDYGQAPPQRYNTGYSQYEPPGYHTGYNTGYTSGYNTGYGQGGYATAPLPRPSTGYAPRRRGSATQRAMARAQARRRKKRRRRALLILILALILLVVFVLPPFLGINLDQDVFGGFFGRVFGGGGSSSLPPSSLSVSMPGDGYDPAAYSIPLDIYGGVILQEGSDGGDEYVADTLFLGDDNVERMPAFGVTSQSNSIGIRGLRIGEVTSRPVVKFEGMDPVAIPQAVKVMQPLRVVTCFGYSDLGMGTAEFIDAYRTAIQAIQEQWPYAQIIIASVLPVARNTAGSATVMTQIDQFNLELVKLAQEQGLPFLNWGTSLRSADDGFARADYMLDDGALLSQGGMQMLFGYLRAHTHATQDTRPKPLKEIPARQALEEGTGTDTSLPATGASSSAPSSSQPPANPQPTGSVTVIFNAGDGGSLSSGGSSSKSFRVTAAPGSTCGGVTAVPDPNNIFQGWSSTHGGIGNPGATTLHYTVPSGTASGSTITVTAAFFQQLIKVPSLVGRDYSGVTSNGYYRFEFDGYTIDWQLVVIHTDGTGQAPGTIVDQSPQGGGYVGNDPAGNVLQVWVQK